MIKLITASPASGMSLSDFFPPPAAKTESIQGLAALVDLGQAGGILLFRRHSLALQIKKPQGYWVSGSGCSLGLEFTRRVQSLRWSAA